ncbi:hypothetical protein HDIA_1484 [Hartmannibacter diazotrophicus]|uniref:Uncharacterized protein n=1 Tax=Hartmannibacter diazotrophicus TaxID=1482074 RepID=A0A2C9D679_9HYPH|nr:DUF1488 family protein [Hartmannibacter diazotrophicus]SON55025.1 hypothetical protein HDIA_1484 [Hartmannibacter diazotrophicus]
MALNFINPSRSFDASGKRIGFVGHDGMFEIPFYVSAELFPKAGCESDYLAAFDAGIDVIHEAARKVYVFGSQEVYVLNRKNCRSLN